LDARYCVCLGYPSDSSRAARELAQETSCGRQRAGPGRRGRAGFFLLCPRHWPVLPFSRPVRSRPSTVWASSRFDPRQCGFALPLAGLCEYYLGLCGLAPRPCGLPLHPCGSPLSHMAGVGQCPLAIGHGCLVGLLASVLDRRPVSPLPSTSACSEAGSGWHGCRWIIDSVVYSEGLAPVVPAFARACSAGPSPCCGSPASRGFAGLGDTGLSAACQLAGTTADALSAKLAVSPRCQKILSFISNLQR
jgi:hypothetical protein